MIKMILIGFFTRLVIILAVEQVGNPRQPIEVVTEIKTRR